MSTDLEAEAGRINARREEIRRRMDELWAESCALAAEDRDLVGELEWLLGMAPPKPRSPK
jgi:hypothetical protein